MPADSTAARPPTRFETQGARHLTAFFTPLATLTPAPVQWLWPGRIPLGKLTILCGQPEVGKSFCAADIAAHVTAALPWPDADSSASLPATDSSRCPADVLFCCAEDD